MTIDLDKILNTDLSYPGIDYGYESWALQVYLKVLEEHVPFAQNQYKLRAERDLESRVKDLEPEQLNQKHWEIEEAVETHIPRFFHVVALVPIWGLFESFVSDIADYVGRRELPDFFLRDVRASNFREQAEKYFEGALRITLPWSENERTELKNLQELRNLVAHRNGRVSDLSAEKQKEIGRLVDQINGAKIDNGRLIVSGQYISRVSSLVFSMVGNLSQMIADRYDGPTTAAIKPAE